MSPPSPPLTPGNLDRCPAPPPTRQLLGEEYNDATRVTYRVYTSGHVLAYGTEDAAAGLAPTDDGITDRTRWCAVVWTAHPLLVPRRAQLVTQLATQATYAELWRAITRWEDGPLTSAHAPAESWTVLRLLGRSPDPADPDTDRRTETTT